jgi:HlyD family secretion protein
MSTSSFFGVTRARTNTSWQFILRHKIWSSIVVLLLLWGGWWAYGTLTSTTGEVRYVLGTVQTGSIVSSVSESGQVSTSNSVNIESQASGEITWVGVAAGDQVRTGQALMTIDDTSAVQAINDAKNQLASDELQYQQSTAQAPVSYQDDVTALATSQEDLQDDYNSTFNDLANTYLDLPAVMTGANDVLYGYDFDTKKEQWNLDFLTSLFNSTQNTSNVATFKTAAENDYTTANTSYTTGVTAYTQVTRTSDTSTIDSLLAQSTTMMTDVAQALQSELNFYGAVSDLAQTYNVHLPSNFATLQSDTRSYLSTTNSDLSTLLADKKTLDAAKQTILNDQQTVALDQVGNPDGTNPISLQVSKDSIEKEQEDLADQETDLANYTITAPFDGTLSAVNFQVGDQASGAAATIISNDQIAELSLNEVDVAKIKLGDKATLTFDAIDGLTLTGTVAEIDTVGTVSQGVVSYDVKIAFDAQNAQIKPGMTVNAVIETAADQNALIVPQTAVKTVGGASYVQVFNPSIASSTIVADGSQGVLPTTTAPEMVPVTTGLSDTTNIEILSGLTEGEQIVVSTKTATAVKVTAAAATTGTGAARGGAGGFGGGAGAGGAALRGL